MLMSDNGIIKQAINGREQTEIARLKENIELALTSSYSDKGEYNIDNFIKTLENDLGITAVKNENNTIIIIYNGYNILVSSSGKFIMEEGEVTTGSNHSSVSLSYNWQEIENIAKIISRNDKIITSNTEEVITILNGKNYSIGIGDTIKVKYNNETYIVRVLGFNHDELSDKTKLTAYNEEGHTYAGISFEFTTDIGKACMNSATDKYPNGTSNGGWAECEMRKITLSGKHLDIKDMNSQVLDIKEVKKDYYDKKNINSCNDYLWLLSRSEIWNEGSYSDLKDGKQYKYYKNIGASYTVRNPLIMKEGNEGTGSTLNWWLRSVVLNYFIYATADSWYYPFTTSIFYISPGFAI